MNTESDQIVEKWIIKHKLIVCSIGVFCGLVMFYGVTDDNQKRVRFFEEGDGINAEYWVRVGGQLYHNGEMVSHWAIISILTVLGIIFVLMGNYGIEDYLEKKRYESLS